MTNRALAASLWCLLLVLVSSAASPQTPAGAEFRVNTYTTNSQASPSVAADGKGNFVVVWASLYQDGSSDGVFGQEFGASGAAQGPEFRVNTYSSGSQYLPSVARAPDGRFVVVWTSDGQDGSSAGVFGQQFGASGAPQGPEFQVNTYTTSQQYRPSVAVDAAGNFVVVWTSVGQDGSQIGVFGRRFDMSGSAQGPEFRANTYTSGYQGLSSVAMAPDGRFVVVWNSNGQDGSGNGVFGQRYDASGTPLGGEFQVNTYTTNNQFDPSVAFDASANFVVVWNSQSGDGSGFGVFGQRYDASGTPLGGEFQVNTHTVGYQGYPSIASDASGNFLVAWHSAGQDGSGLGAYAQRYDASGTARGGEFRINTFTTGEQQTPAVASDPSGNFVATWSSFGQDGSGFGIYAQRYGGLLPAALAVDASPSASSNGNQVFEAGETATVSPSWRNVNGTSQAFTGAASNFTGPGAPSDPVYSVPDATADYGTVSNDATGSCAATSNCYLLGTTVPTTRPVRHWDATFTEDILPVEQGQSKIWTIHVGDSFADVPRPFLFYRFVETMLHRGVTGGCTATEYCPNNSVTRGQMAVFLLRSREGPTYAPPPCVTPTFGDVPCSHLFAAWIEELVQSRHLAEQAAGIMVALEGQLPTMYTKYVETCRGMGFSDRELRFFTVHIEGDAEHADVGYRLAERYASTPELEAMAVGACRASVQMRRAYLEAVTRAIREMGVPAYITDSLSEADLVLTLKSQEKRQPKRLRDAAVRGMPLHVLRSNTVTQIEHFLREVFEVAEGPAEHEAALTEVEEALARVFESAQPVELRPQNSYIRRLQHQLVQRYGLASESKGDEPFRRVVIYPR